MGRQPLNSQVHVQVYGPDAAVQPVPRVRVKGEKKSVRVEVPPTATASKSASTPAYDPPRFEDIPDVPPASRQFVYAPTWWAPEKKWYMVKLRRCADWPSERPVPAENLPDTEKDDRPLAIQAVRDACEGALR